MSAHELAKLSHPTNAEIVTPNDSLRLSNSGILYVGGAGNVSVITQAGNTVTFNDVKSGTFLPVQISFVRATGTTATNLLVLW